MEVFFIWLLFVVFSGVLASNKKRSVIGWVLIAMATGPFGLIVGFMSELKENDSGINCNSDTEIIAEYTNNKYLIDIPSKLYKFEDLKSKLIKEYTRYGLDNKKIDNAKILLLKSNDESAYVQLELRGDKYKIEIFNTKKTKIFDNTTDKDNLKNIPGNNNISDELLKLAQLKEKGILTDEEFITQKEKLLNS